jgi:hypothetical protein
MHEKKAKFEDALELENNTETNVWDAISSINWNI